MALSRPLRSTPDPIRELIHLSVCSSKLFWPEYCFEIIINFKRVFKTDPTIAQLKNVIIALLNTAGGLIIINTKQEQPIDSETADRWKLQLEDALVEFIPLDVCTSCIKLMDHYNSFILVVRKSPKLIVLNYHMVIRWLAGNRVVKNTDDVIGVIKNKSLKPYPNPFELIEKVKYKDTLHISENQNIELKVWNKVKVFSGKPNDKNTYKARFEDNRVAKSLFALPNMSHGGYLVVGVQEDRSTKTNVILGQVISESDEKKIEEFLEKYLIEDVDGLPRKWGHENKHPVKGKDWTLQFIEVWNCRDERRRLILIGFKHFSGGVFMRTPESFSINEEGYVIAFDSTNWLHHLYTHKCTTIPNSQPICSDSHNTNCAKRRPVNAPTLCSRPVSIKYREQLMRRLSLVDSLNEHRTQNVVERNPRPATTGPLDTAVLSMTANTPNWDEHIGLPPRITDRTISSVSQNTEMFDLKMPMKLTPTKDTIVASQPERIRSGVELAISYIQQSTPANSMSCGLATSYWPSIIQRKTTIRRPSNQLFDICTIDHLDDTTNICLWSVAEKCDATALRTNWKYLFLASRLTKGNVLVDEGTLDASNKINSLVVKCRLYQIDVGEMQFNSIDNTFQRTTLEICEFLASTHDTNMDYLKTRLAQTLLLNETRLRDIFGMDYSIYLTAEQMEIILALGLDKFNYVEGAPGTGKTYLALHMCKRFHCGYICSTPTFKNFLAYQNVHSSFLIQTADDLVEHVTENKFRDLDYLVVDDIHTMAFPRYAWFCLFRCIALSTRTSLVILGDSFYQNYYATKWSIKPYMQEFCKHWKFSPTFKSLSVIHRNSRKVVAFIKSNFLGLPEYPESIKITTTHLECGDDVEVRYMPGVFHDTGANELLKFVEKLIEPKRVIDTEKQSYEARDVAILLDITDVQTSRLWLDKFRNLFSICFKCPIRVQDASTFPVNGLTIDTLENFMGFDRSVCILVPSKDIVHSRSRHGKSFSNPCYRTFVASRAMSKVVFVSPVPLCTTMQDDFQMFVSDINMPATRPNCSVINYGDTDGNLAFLNGSTVRGDKFALAHKFWKEQFEINPRYVACSKDGESFVVLTDERHTWSLYTVDCSRSLLLDKNFSITKEDDIQSICWTPEGNLILVIAKGSLEESGMVWLRKMSPKDSRPIWQRGPDVTKLITPDHVTVCRSNGFIYVGDFGTSSICEFTPDGYPQRTIPTMPHIKYPSSFCIDAEGHTLFTCNALGQAVIVFHLTNEDWPKKIMQTQSGINNLCLIENRLLEIALDQEVLVYDVGECISNHT